MSARPEVIEQLVQAAIEGMLGTADKTHARNDEILSAYFTLMRRGIDVALKISTDPVVTRAALRGSVQTVLADLADDVRN